MGLGVPNMLRLCMVQINIPLFNKDFKGNFEIFLKHLKNSFEIFLLCECVDFVYLSTVALAVK